MIDGGMLSCVCVVLRCLCFLVGEIKHQFGEPGLGFVTKSGTVEHSMKGKMPNYSLSA